eukprot:Opistho-1_new@78889
MAAELRARRVLVDAALVRDKVLVHGEGTLDGAVRHNLRLDLGVAAANRVGRGALVQVARVRNGVARLARLDALGGRSLLAVARGEGATHVVLARGNRVGLARVRRVVEAASDEASVLPVRPGTLGVATVAAHAAREAAARHEVLSADDGLLGTVRRNANAVRNGLNGTKGPARAAGTLVADHRDRLAVGPLRARIKRVGDALGNLNVGLGELVLLGRLEGTEKLADVVKVLARKAGVVAGLPRAVERVDVVGDGLVRVEGGRGNGHGHAGGENSNGELHLRITRNSDTAGRENVVPCTLR